MHIGLNGYCVCVGNSRSNGVQCVPYTGGFATPSGIYEPLPAAGLLPGAAAIGAVQTGYRARQSSTNGTVSHFQHSPIRHQE